MNSENSKTSDAHRLRLNLKDKMDLQRGDIMLRYQQLCCKDIKHQLQRKYAISLSSLQFFMKSL